MVPFGFVHLLFSVFHLEQGKLAKSSWVYFLFVEPTESLRGDAKCQANAVRRAVLKKNSAVTISKKKQQMTASCTE